MDSGIDSQSEVLKYHVLICAPLPVTDMHAGLLLEIIQRSEFQFLYFCKQRLVTYF